MGDAQADVQITGLALAAGEGDRAALADFVRATQRDVFCFIKYVCERDEAEDLTQETYLRALRALPSFAGRSSARTWLLSIARRVAADQIRRARARPRTTAVEECRDWDRVAAGDRTRWQPGFDEGVLLRELVARLEPGRRDAFVLTQMLGLDYAAAAGVCDCPVGTIRSRVARAREDLVRAMNAPALPDHQATGRLR